MSEEKSDYNPADHMLNLKGKDYLPVAARIVWLRREHPHAVIRTKLVEHDPQGGFALYRAEVELPDGGYAEATATQSRKQFGDYLEKCETKAIGRALGFLGYGTMAAFEDEPDNPLYADAPVDRPQPRPAPNGNRTVKYNDPRHATQYNPRQQVREELAARQATPLPPKAFDAAINQAWTDFEDGKDEGSIFDTLDALEPRMSEEQRIVKIQQRVALEQAIAERRAVPAGHAG
jgi:hypothetical protein